MGFGVGAAKADIAANYCGLSRWFSHRTRQSHMFGEVKIFAEVFSNDDRLLNPHRLSTIYFAPMPHFDYKNQ